MSGSSVGMSASSTEADAASQAIPFVANHHRVNNPDDAKLRATPSIKSRRTSLFGGVLKGRSKDASQSTLTQSSSKPPRPDSNSGSGHRTTVSTSSPSEHSPRGVASSITSSSPSALDPESEGTKAVNPRPRSSSRSRRHSLGVTLMASRFGAPSSSQQIHQSALPINLSQSQGHEFRAPQEREAGASRRHDPRAAADLSPSSDELTQVQQRQLQVQSQPRSHPDRTTSFIAKRSSTPVSPADEFMLFGSSPPSSAGPHGGPSGSNDEQATQPIEIPAPEAFGSRSATSNSVSDMPSIGRRVRSLRIGDSQPAYHGSLRSAPSVPNSIFTPPDAAVASGPTIIATPPTPRLPQMQNSATSEPTGSDLQTDSAPTIPLRPAPSQCAGLTESLAPADAQSDHSSSLPRFHLAAGSPSRANTLEPRNPIVTAGMALSSSVSSPSALITSPQRYSSLGRSAGKRSVRGGFFSSSAQDLLAGLDGVTDARDNVNRKERRMSMLDFLMDEQKQPQEPATLDEDLRDSSGLREPQLGKRRRSDEPSAVPPSMPLLQASRQRHHASSNSSMGRKAPEVKASMVDFSERVRVAVEPLTDHLTMFGSTQTSSNYSLAGTVVLEMPRDRSKFHILTPTPALAAAHIADTSCLSSSPTDEGSSGSNSGARVDGTRPSVHVEKLSVRFCGFAVYVDATGRFNALKLVDISQDLLQPEGCLCYLDVGEELDAASATQWPQSRPLKYEIEFDVSVPGWLPGSQRSRFGGTFYCIQAETLVDGQRVVSHVSNEEGTIGLFGQSPPFTQGFTPSFSSSPTSLVALESNAAAVFAAQNVGDGIGTGGTLGSNGFSSNRAGSSRAEASNVRGKNKASWLNKTAKQLQLRTSKKASLFDVPQFGLSDSRRGSGFSNSGQAGGTSQGRLSQKLSEAANVLLPSGKRSVKSECTSVLIRRCRDVVPVPVARLGMPGLASRSPLAQHRMDAQPSIAQSFGSNSTTHPMPANRNTVASSGAEVVTPEAVPSERPETRRPLPSSVSAPGNLLAAACEVDSAGVSRGSSNAATRGRTVGSESQGSDVSKPPDVAGLAPSPVINEAPARFAPSATSIDTPLAAATRLPESLERSRQSVLRPVPSAFDAPTDPLKLAAAGSSLSSSSTMPNIPASMSRASSLARLAHASSPPRTSSRAVSSQRNPSSAPMRHFLHRPSLQLPPELGITGEREAAGGLTFSLTISLPSHVQVTGPKSDVLSFGVQIEVGKTAGWDAVRKLGGLRLKDMELVCLQTERHSSMPSRSFCAAFPMPPPPNQVAASELPIVSVRKSRSSMADDDASSLETRLRQGYDRDLVLGHIDLANLGKAPDPVEHNVERIRTTIVGPPPSVLRKTSPGASPATGKGAKPKGKGRAASKADSADRSSNNNGRDRSRDAGTAAGTIAGRSGPTNGLAAQDIHRTLHRNAASAGSPQGSPAGSGASTPVNMPTASRANLRAAFAPAAQVGTGSGGSVMQPAPRALARSRNASTSSLRQLFTGGASNEPSVNSGSGPGSVSVPPSPRTISAPRIRTRLPIPFESLSGNVGLSESLATEAGHESASSPAGGQGAPLETVSRIASAAAASSTVSRRGLQSSSEGGSAVEVGLADTSASGSGSVGTGLGASTGSDATRSRDMTTAAVARTAPATTTTSSVSTAPSTQPSARRRRFENAINRLSTFASSMLEQNVDQNSLGPGEQTSGGGTAERNGSGEASLRATYAFSGDDGQGVDLTKGRVRMTINLPLVSSDASVARRMNSAQLMSDFESPYVRIRHKLKVKLGFGLHTDVATSEGAAWGQALVMCVPVRFTEAPPKEVQDHFAPESRSAGRNRSRSDLTSADRRNVGSHGLDDGSVAETERGNNGRSEGSVDNASSGASAAIAEDAIVPLLPAYAQLFREDGSRLADEGEDLPRYPGRMSVIGEIDVDPANITSNGVIAQLPRVDEDVGDDSTAASGSDATVPPYGGGDTTLASASAQNKIVGGAEVAATSAALAGTPPPPMPSSLASTRSPSTYNFSSLPQGIRASPSAPMPMDRSTSLPGHRVLFRTASSGTVGLRTSPSYSVLQGGGSYTMDQTVASAGLGSSAFDPLPARPAMRRRSATTTSLVSASRVLPSEVLDESLVTDAMEDEEDRMDRLRADQVEDVYEDRDVLDLNDEEEEDDVDEEQAVRRDDVDAEEDDGELGDGPEVDEDSEGNMPSDQQRSSRESQTSQVGRGRSMGFAMNLQLAEDQHAGTLAGEGDDEADDAEYIGDVHPAEAEAIVQVGQAW